MFQLLLEICEVIETFTTNDFFFPDNQTGNVGQNFEHALVHSIGDVRKKYFEQKKKFQQLTDSKNDNLKISRKDSNLNEIGQTVLKVLSIEKQEGGTYQSLPCRIVFTEFLLAKLREEHGAKLIPIISNLHELYLMLSNYIVNFSDDISSGAFEDPKHFGKRLISYIITLSEQGAREQQYFNYQVAFQKYEQADFLISELIRDINNSLRFSVDYSEQSERQDTHKKSGSPGLFDSEHLSSFTFVNREDSSKEPMFDLENENLLVDLRKMVRAKLLQVEKLTNYQ